MTTSPCIGICEMDAATGWCRGCGRSREELAGWGSRAPEDRAAIWAALPARLDRLGVALRRPDLDQKAVRSTVLDRMRHGSGLWSIGAASTFAGAAMHGAAMHGADVQIDGGTILARSERCAMRLRLDPQVRLMRQSDSATGGEVVVLAIPRMRLPDERPDVVTEIGPDAKALLPEAGEGILFDLGLGMPAARCMLRTADPALLGLLRRFTGAPWQRLLAEAGTALDAAGPARIVEAPGARIEIGAAVLSADGRRAEADRAAPLSAALAGVGALPLGIELPEALSPMAIHFVAGRSAAA